MFTLTEGDAANKRVQDKICGSFTFFDKILLKYFDLPHRNLLDSANLYPGLVTRKLCSCFCLWQIQVQLKIPQSEKDTIRLLECVFMISNGMSNLIF